MDQNREVNSAVMDNQSLATIVADLQSRMAFQDDTIQTLSDVMAEQQQQITRLEKALELHREKLLELMADLEQRSVNAGQAVDERPPHY